MGTSAAGYLWVVCVAAVACGVTLVFEPTSISSLTVAGWVRTKVTGMKVVICLIVGSGGDV